MVISDVETELVDGVEEGDLLWDYLDQLDDGDTNLLVSLYVQRTDGGPGALLTKAVLEEAITLYAEEIAEEFGYPVGQTTSNCAKSSRCFPVVPSLFLDIVWFSSLIFDISQHVR